MPRNHLSTQTDPAVMDSLKQFEELCQPDVRQKFFARVDASSPSGHRSVTLKDFYETAESIQLHDGVPEQIRDQFQTARNLIIYSWFYYPLNVTADLCAYATAEHALRIKAGKASARSSFRRLLKKAVEENWIRDEHFTHVKWKHESLREYNESLPPEYRHPQSQLAQDYCKVMTDTWPKRWHNSLKKVVR